MALRINQNILSMRTHSQLAQTTERLEKSVEKLSSGLRINRASDDAAGLAISEKLRRQIRGLNRSVLNAQDGVSMIQSAEGALNESQANLQRMRELAIQASNDTLTSNDRLEIQKEVDQLRDDLNRIAHNTDFNTKKLLDGSQTGLASSSVNTAKAIINGLVTEGDFSISLAVLKGGASQLLRSQIFTKVADGTIASGSTQLLSISQFYDTNGTFLLESPSSLTLSGNGRTASIQIDSGTTLGYLQASIALATKSTTGLDIGNTKVQLITSAISNIQGKGGYFEITSGIIGENGRITFAGEQPIMNALGIGEVREAVNNIVQATAIDDQTANTTIVQTNDGRVAGLLSGMDVKFSGQAAQVIGTGGILEGLSLVAAASFQINNIGGQAAIDVTVTINAGTWTMEGLVHNIQSAINAVAGAEGLTASLVNGELRLTYVKSNPTWTDSFDIAAATGETIGFTDGTYNSFVTATKDTTATQYGLTRLMTAGATAQVVHTLVDDVGTTAVVTVMATISQTAGVADMVAFSAIQALVNTQIAATSVYARVDMVGGTLAYTSTILGTQTPDAGTAVDSYLSMTISSGVAAVTQQAYLKLGFVQPSNNSTGDGDTNFRFHVVDNTPQFHIGADQGQIMKITMSDMSAESLGVEALDFTSIDGAARAMGKINRALDRVSAERSKLGSYQNRLEYAINNLNSMSTNAASAESRLRDVDVAQEMIEFTRNQIINQSGTAMLAQANLVPQGVLQLLR